MDTDEHGWANEQSAPIFARVPIPLRANSCLFVDQICVYLCASAAAVLSVACYGVRHSARARTPVLLPAAGASVARASCASCPCHEGTRLRVNSCPFVDQICVYLCASAAAVLSVPPCSPCPPWCTPPRCPRLRGSPAAEGAELFSHRWARMGTDDPRRHTKAHEELETGNWQPATSN